jgi:hypothetical protein
VFGERLPRPLYRIQIGRGSITTHCENSTTRSAISPSS